jgi:predicted CoA-binding protein
MPCSPGAQKARRPGDLSERISGDEVIFSMIKGDIKRILNPQTIALVGATEKEGAPGRTLLENLSSWSKDLRKILPVNPSRKAVLGYECYPAISAVPEHVDLAIVVTPAPKVPEIVEECGRVDTEGIIIISAGSAEDPSLFTPQPKLPWTPHEPSPCP